MKKRLIKVLVYLIILIILGMLYIILNKKYNIYIPCIFHKLTGLYCPGCGATRCIISLLKGNIKESFSNNILFFIMLPFIIMYILYKIYLYIYDKKDKIIVKIPKQITIILLIITIIFGIIRNIPGFEYLKP